MTDDELADLEELFSKLDKSAPKKKTMKKMTSDAMKIFRGRYGRGKVDFTTIFIPNVKAPYPSLEDLQDDLKRMEQSGNTPEVLRVAGG